MMTFKIDRYSGIDLADQIHDAIIGEIEIGRLRAGDKLPTMQEIAQATQVTFRTARNVIERLAREGHVVSRPGIGTVVTPKEITIWRGRVLFISREEDETSFYVHGVMGELRRRLIKSGYLFFSVVASRQPNGDRSQLRAMLASTVDFAIVMYDSPLVEQMLAAAAVPYVVVSGEGKSRKGAWQIPFNPTVAINAFISHCRQRKVRCVMQVDFDDNLIRPMDRALAAAGIATNHVKVPSKPELGRFAGLEQSAREVFLAYPQKDYPDVFFIWDLFVARGFFAALEQLGVRIPEEVGVVVQTNPGLGLAAPCSVTRFEAGRKSVATLVADFVLTVLMKKRVPKVPTIGRDYVIGGTFPFDF